ncbi:hypothetical protein AMTR_s00109p00112350 [Amborella trichopoda]|uniref:RING-type domain-containing protein n=1 Tax=Amborella trichopoda TaxID=13333 RepID=W1NPL6_AMBTC|nr:hypothetical protein AMTR_s00109p00112350 [Amborella trichopoda]
MVSWKTILLAFGITTIDVGMLELASAIGGSVDDDEELEEFFDNEEEMNMKRPLVPEIIISIPTLKIGSVSSPYFSKNNFCLICWENFMEGEIVKESNCVPAATSGSAKLTITLIVKELYPCSHIFHGACIDKWLGAAN